MTRIGEIVRSERERQALTQNELALAAGVSYRTVLQIEKGKPTTRLDVLVRVLESLGLTLDVRAAPRSLEREATEPLAHFEVDHHSSGAYTWLMRAANGDVLARSPVEYDSRAAALAAAHQVSSIAEDDQLLARSIEIFSIRRVYHWRLRGATGVLLATNDAGFASRRVAQRAARHALLSAALAEIE